MRSIARSTLRRLRAIASDAKRRLDHYRAIARHPRTPWVSKALLLLALGYLLMPFDLIPDWIPVLGVLDDVIIVPGLVALALWLVPRDVRRDPATPEPRP